MTARDLSKLGAGLLLGVVLAFPAGMMAARLAGDSEPGGGAQRRGSAAVRDVFSPSVRSDPWFLERQREGVEALERHCASTGESCPEAQEARRLLAELEAGD